MEKIKNKSYFKWPNKRDGAVYQRDRALRPALGTINVIFAKSRGDVGIYSGVMSVVSSPNLEDRSQAFK